MQIVITMAGLGSRFKKAGYTCPKYEIEAFGKTLFEYSMESLKGYYSENNSYYFIVRSDDNARDFIYEKSLDMGICKKENIKIIEIDYMTDGQATTAMLAKEYWDKNDSLMIYNIDTYIEAYELKLEDIEGDGFIPCFKAEGDHWSFVKLDENGDATEVREKVRISDNCTIGAYYFKSCELYEKMYEEYYTSGRKLDANEKYVAPLYNYMIEKGMTVRICDVDAKRVHVLGTPEELNVFLESGSKK